MKIRMLFGLMLFSVVGIAQVVDTAAAVREIDSLIQATKSFVRQGNFDKALEINSIAEELALKMLGRETVSYGNACFNCGRVNHIKGDYLEAEKWYLEAIAIRAKVIGKAHPDYAKSLGNLANLYQVMYDYEKAEQLFMEAEAIISQSLGKAHPDYANILNNFGILYRHMGNYEKAEPLLLEAKAIWGKALGKEHEYYASSVNNLAVLYWQMGDYEKAERFNLEALAIREKTMGEESPEFAASLKNLADLYSDLGDNKKAETFYLEAKAIWEKTIGREHPVYAELLNNFAILYRVKGDYKNAIALFLEALAIKQQAQGRYHPDCAYMLNNLGISYTAMGDYGNAELYFLEAKDIQEKALKIDHPDYASILNGLANLYQRKGIFGKAERLFMESMSIYEKTSGKYHPDYVMSLYDLALLYRKMNAPEKAEPLLIAVSNLQQALTTKALYHLTDHELNKYIQKISKSQHQIFSFAQTPFKKQNNFYEACFDNTLFYKGFLLNASNQVKRLSLSDSTTTKKYNLLISYERRLAAEYAKPTDERKNVPELEEKANSLEKELVRTVAGLGEALQQVTWKDVQAKLKPGEAVVEFVNYQYQNPNPTDSTIYAALLLLPGNAPPRFFPLFEEREIKALIKGAMGSNLDGINALYSPHEKGMRSLYELIWQPMEAQLKGVKTIYCSPSGLLHRLNLGAIPVKGSKTFSDVHGLVILGSSRQLVVPNLNNSNVKDAYVAGGIIYDMDSTAIQSAKKSLISRGWEESNTLAFHPEDSLRGDVWKYLKGSYSEALVIDSILKSARMTVQLETGYSATEEAFRSIGQGNPSPRIVHVATHGFFFPDPKSKDEGRGVRDDETIFKVSEHPMMRSGLVLAGANEAWTTGKAPENREDGILTAYEISQMNLSNTELVVLSACETGLGDIDGNEGVYGLQRAFKIAGAKYLIMSLWKVSDQATRELMTEFYRQWLDRSMAIPDAFRTAQKNMRTKHPGSPFLWAGFVLVE